MKRRKWLLMHLCLLLILPVVVSGNTDLEEYKPETLVQANVGPKEGEFGLREGLDIQAVGAAFFALSPSGEIYIYDKAKNDIKHFGQTGEFIRAIPLGNIHPYDLQVDEDGKIYLFYDWGYPGEERYFVYQLSPGGKLQTTIKVLDTPEIGYHRIGRFTDDTPLHGIVSLYLVNKDLYLYDRVSNKSLPLIENGKILNSSQIKRGMFEAKLTIAGLKWAVNRDGGIDLYNEKGKFLKHIFHTQRKFIDMDGDGNFYFYDSNGVKREKGKRKIVKFDQEGHLKAEIERTVHHYTARIKNRGDIVITSKAIYTLNVYRDKVEVTKHSLLSKAEKGDLEK